MGGWKEHAIFIFSIKNTDETYDLGIINAGQGSEIQGIDGDLTNGIVIFKNINEEKITNFVLKYNK